MKRLTMLLVAVMAGAMLWSGAAKADEDRAVIQAHAITLYPGTVQVFEKDPCQVYTKDPIDKVKKYFEGHAQNGDKFEAMKEDNAQGWRLNYHAVVDGAAQQVMEAELTEFVSDSNIVEALGALKSQQLIGKHSEQEFQALEKKYKNLANAYYKEVDDGKGGKMSEDKLLYKRAEQEAYTESDQKKAAKASDAFADKKAKAKELKAQMKALKAKGDIAGMMKLAQENKMTDAQSAAVSGAMGVATKDTWNVWVKCLEDTAKAAYWTRILYNASALPGKK